MTKSEIRKEFLRKRNALSDEYRLSADSEIFSKLIHCEEYVKSDLILVYVSVGSEIDTSEIIKYSFNSLKRVAVPFCRNGRMDFYEIFSTDELTASQFGIPTVDISDRTAVEMTDNTLCIVPALCLDINGNRVGYGGGYYDRFLREYGVNHVCLVRKDFIIENLPAEDSDFQIRKYITD